MGATAPAALLGTLPADLETARQLATVPIVAGLDELFAQEAASPPASGPLAALSVKQATAVAAAGDARLAEAASRLGATVTMLEAALEGARNVAGFLSEFCGFPAALVADSGNGAHLLYRIDLPNDDATTALIKRCLAAVKISTASTCSTALAPRRRGRPTIRGRRVPAVRRFPEPRADKGSKRDP